MLFCVNIVCDTDITIYSSDILHSIELRCMERNKKGNENEYSVSIQSVDESFDSTTCDKDSCFTFTYWCSSDSGKNKLSKCYLVANSLFFDSSKKTLFLVCVL